MAIKKTIDTIYGVTVVDAYIRVSDLRIINKVTLAFNVCAYADSSKSAIQEAQVQCGYDLNGANPLEQAYTHLKTLPEFAGAVDC